ncbi:MAG: response regulator transcription factor [Nocardioides sp.]|nr:response regulator transcription factor [Nocardioides sp.]
MVRVLLVDDQELVRSGLRRVLRRRDGVLVVGECDDGDQVPAAVAAHAPDVVVMDLRMRRVNGIDATRALRGEPDAPPVLVLTTFDDDELLAGALRAGASGFLLKDSPAEDVVRGVLAVADGRSVLDPAVTSRVLDAFRSAPEVAPPVDTPLTERELEVLQLMGRGLSNGEIAGALVISEVTVKSHIGRIFTKLDLRDRAAAIVYAFDRGLVAPGGSR